MKISRLKEKGNLTGVRKGPGATGQFTKPSGIFLVTKKGKKAEIKKTREQTQVEDQCKFKGRGCWGAMRGREGR